MSKNTPEQMLFNVFAGTGEEVDVDNDTDQVEQPDVLDGDPTDLDDDVDNDEVDEDESDTDEYDEDEEDDDFDDEDDDDAEDDDDEEEPEEGDQSPGYLYLDESEGREIFLRGEDPITGEKSVYLTREEAQTGLSKQLEYIGELKKQVAEVSEQTASQLANLEGEVQLYRSIMTQDAAKAALIEDKMPDKFKGVDPTALTVDGDIKAYKLARIDAEVAVEREIREAKAAAADQARARQEAKDNAAKHIRSRSNDLKFFGMSNVEDRMTLAKRMNEKVEGTDRTVKDTAMSIAEMFGVDAADAFLKGTLNVVVPGTTESADNKSVAKTKSKSTDTKNSSKKRVEKAKKVKSRPKKVGGNKSSGLERKTTDRNPRNTILNAFKNQT